MSSHRTQCSPKLQFFICSKAVAVLQQVHRRLKKKESNKENTMYSEFQGTFHMVLILNLSFLEKLKVTEKSQSLNY